MASISETAKIRKANIKAGKIYATPPGKPLMSQDAKQIKNRQNAENSEYGFKRGGGK